MPLRDHFHPPLFPTRPWESFYLFWMGHIATYLNRVLPKRYAAELFPHPGRRIQDDLTDFENGAPEEDKDTLPDWRSWAAPVAARTFPAVYPDEFEVRVINTFDDGRLVGVVALVGPRNKESEPTRRAFAIKCAAHLQRGIGLLTLDIVTSHAGNMHDALTQVLDLKGSFAMPEGSLSTVAYRPVRREDTDQIDFWAVPLAIGAALPTLPLGLRGARPVLIDLEATYTEARVSSRL
jgi:hypothetical protein